MTTQARSRENCTGSVTSHELTYRLEVFPVWRVEAPPIDMLTPHRQLPMPDLGKMPVERGRLPPGSFGVDLDKIRCLQVAGPAAGMLSRPGLSRRPAANALAWKYLRSIMCDGSACITPLEFTSFSVKGFQLTMASRGGDLRVVQVPACFAAASLIVLGRGTGAAGPGSGCNHFSLEETPKHFPWPVCRRCWISACAGKSPCDGACQNQRPEASQVAGIAHVSLLEISID